MPPAVVRGFVNNSGYAVPKRCPLECPLWPVLKGDVPRRRFYTLAHVAVAGTLIVPCLCPERKLSGGEELPVLLPPTPGPLLRPSQA